MLNKTQDKPLQVMVVDDSTLYRMIMKKSVTSIPNVEVPEFAANGKIALEKLANSRSTIDVVLLDVEMPEMDGLTALKSMRKLYPQLVVIMVSATSRTSATIVMECLQVGAMEFVTKPLEKNVDLSKKALEEALTPIFQIIREKKATRSASISRSPAQKTPIKRPLAKPTPAAVAPKRETANKVSASSLNPKLVLIGSSTGGPVALSKVLVDIGGKLNIPIMIVQHMPPLFVNSLAAQITKTSGRAVNVAEDNQVVKPGDILIAPGGVHLTVKRHGGNGLRTSLTKTEKVQGCRPSVDVLFQSVANTFSGPVLSVILTGMGKDGADGVQALKNSIDKVYCITQDQASCVVYGMPRATDELGLSDESKTLNAIGGRIMNICS
ncbi:MAG: chemotaxis-specific protein-glutamate methyltransferase CheB [Magnetococcales bacterium]|nr:chemotaxis-specific protein-glutamate methyltransferase CheB [Magnetococcales bacterium]